MNFPKLIFILMSVSLGLWSSIDAFSQEKAAETTLQQPGDSEEMTDGVIRKIDRDNKKITIKHGEIKNLDMPGMTMVFQVKDPAVLDTVKTGDKVKFRAEKAGGSFVVTEIQVNN